MNLQEQEQEATRILAQVPASTLGDRLRRARLRQGRSIRELATAAELSKTSIVRLEQGGTSSPLTIVKVCAALGLHLAGLAAPHVGDGDGDGQNVVVHRHSSDRWYDMTNFGAGPLGGLDRPLTASERAAFVAQEAKTLPLLLLTSRLPDGRLLPTILEVWSRSARRSHPGEELVYVLEGSAIVHVGETYYAIAEGESIVFHSAEPHTYAPAEGSQLPVRLLSVRLDERVRS